MLEHTAHPLFLKCLCAPRFRGGCRGRGDGGNPGSMGHINPPQSRLNGASTLVPFEVPRLISTPHDCIRHCLTGGWRKDDWGGGCNATALDPFPSAWSSRPILSHRLVLGGQTHTYFYSSRPFILFFLFFCFPYPILLELACYCSHRCCLVTTLIQHRTPSISIYINIIATVQLYGHQTVAGAFHIRHPTKPPPAHSYLFLFPPTIFSTPPCSIFPLLP